MNLEQDISMIWRDARDIKVAVCAMMADPLIPFPDPERMRRDLVEAAHYLESAAWHIAGDAGCRREAAE